jgi:hypothetical protein
MSETSNEPIIDIEASADGTRNTYSSRCAAISQVMNYAACLWRQGVLSKPNVKTPTDWDQCRRAAEGGKCNAVSMRREEHLAGKAIYFRERTATRVSAVGNWSHSSQHIARRPAPLSAPAAPVVKPKKTSVLDAMGDAGSYTQAIKAAQVAPVSVQVAPVSVQVTPDPVMVVTPAAPKQAANLPTLQMLPGESPLAFARRRREAAAQ